MIRVTCPKCGDRLNLKNSMAGKFVACPECQSTLSVPSAVKLSVTSPAPEPAPFDFAATGQRTIEHKARSPFRTAFAVGAGWSLATIVVSIGLIVACVALCCGVPLFFFGVGAHQVAEHVATTPTSKATVATTPEPIPRALPVATKQAVIVGIASVTVQSVLVDKVEAEELGQPVLSEDSHLQIRIRITNKSQTKRIEYKSWHRSFNLSPASLRDEFDNRYKRVNFGILARAKGQINDAAINPGEWIEDVLIFESPIARARINPGIAS